MNPDEAYSLPSAVRSEAAFLGVVLSAPADILDEAVTRIRPEHFYAAAHRTLWEQLVAMHAERRPIDLHTVSDRLTERHLVESVGGLHVLSELLINAGSAAIWRTYAEKVVEKAQLRSLIAACREITQRCYADGGEAADIVTDAISQVTEIGVTDASADTVRHVREYALAAVNEIEHAYTFRGRTVGIPTGFADLDRMMGGWQRSCTYYIGGRPAMGKSTIGSDFAWEIATPAVQFGADAIIFSVEMTGVHAPVDRRNGRAHHRRFPRPHPALDQKQRRSTASAPTASRTA
jgi:replicative DNA helicase